MKVRDRSQHLLLPAIAVFLLGSTLSAGASGSRKDAGIGDADANQLRSHVEYLASDKLDGRLVGTEGIALAEEYIASQFESLGLESLSGVNGYYQQFSLRKTGFRADGSVLSASEIGFVGSAGVNFRPHRYSAPGRVTAPAVFAGFGITARYAGYDDYRDLVVDGKIAIVLYGEPDTDDASSPFYGEASTQHAYFWTKAENAYGHGALGIIIVNSQGRPERPADFRVESSYAIITVDGSVPPNSGPRLGDDFLVAFAAREVLAGIDDAWPVTGAEAEAMVEEGTSPANLGLPEVNIDLIMAAAPDSGPVAVRNVIGVLPGKITDEYVVIGAHHDHMGSFTGVGDTILNGADDNASGVAALLEVARLLSEIELERSVVFVTFTGEEHGRYGSIMTLGDGLLDPARLTSMTNLDMVGRRSDIPLSVYRSDELPQGMVSIETTARAVGISVHVDTEHSEPTDHLTFEQAGVPVISLFSGYHDDFHGVDDEADRLEYDRLADVAELAARIVAGYANSR